MKHFIKHSLFATSALLAGFVSLPLAAASAAAQGANAPQSAAAEGAVLNIEAGQAYEIVQPVLDGSVVLSEGSSLIVAPGRHAINGDMTFGGSGSSVIVVFNKQKQYGMVDIAGKLDIPADANATLSLDLGNARLVQGEKLILFSASEVTGTFNGLSDGDEFDVDGSVLKIGYSSQSVWVTVVKRHRQRMPTPVVEVSTDLIDPSSMGPGII